MKLYIDIRQDDFDVGQEQRQLCAESPDAGGQVLFVGLVRDYSHRSGNQKLETTVEALELSHYEAMTQATIESICQQAGERWSLSSVRVIHRIGRLAAKEQIVLVAVASPHRAEAFAGAEFIMDKLKTKATFWKKEIRSDGEHWLEMKEADKARAKRWQSEC